MNQRTIAEKVSCTGVGLHSGAPVHLTLQPARVGSGVVFVRTDLPTPVEIPAEPDYVVDTTMATTIGLGDATVGTIEHLLAALHGLGIDNVRVELDGPEVPVMDGSAASFVFLIRVAGIYEQRARRRVLKLRKAIEVRDGDRYARIEPISGRGGFRVSYDVDYDHPVIGRQVLRNLDVTPESFEREISRARTFGFMRDVEALWRMGLGKGGSLENAVLLDDAAVMNREGVRWPDEFVRHKVLDLIGDFALLGTSIEGHVKIHKGGHALHQALAAEVQRVIAAEERRSRSRIADRAARERSQESGRL
ncbi:MAG: UDP-3-O-acyl-N-acetylglucosamine deacetylase, partial [Myxococcales bacterium]|nr:UDP-3-O-acyl-N-acetylglucosamine deacetylase [Myxococcales bacterium]